MTCIFKNKVIFIFTLLTILFSGCGYKQTNTQIKDVSFLKFNKSEYKNYTILVNEKHKFNLNACVSKDDNGQCYDDTVNKLYEVKSGNVSIKVLDGKNNLIMKKEMFLGSSNIMEVDLP